MSTIYDNGGYSITGIKTWNTRDGGGFQANILKDGKKVAFVHDDGNGGCYDYEWIGERTTSYTNTYDGKTFTVPCTAAELAFRKHVETLPEYLCEFSGTMDKPNDEMFISQLVELHELTTKVKRWLKSDNTTVAIVGKDVMTWKCVPTPANIQAIWKRHPSAFILNDVASVADAVKAVYNVMEG